MASLCCCLMYAWCDVVCTMIMTLEYTFTLITNWLACLSLLFRMILEKEYINLFSYNEIL